jgi:hypothetical protein
MRKAKEYRPNFEFIADGTSVANAAYHLQFIEYCLEQRKTESSTTRSFLNRTIVIELASIIEMLLYEVLSSLLVEGRRGFRRSLFIPDYIQFDKLIDLAQYYGLINRNLSAEIKAIKTHRNAIHFKKFTKKRILEYNYYEDNLVDTSIATFEKLLIALFSSIKDEKKTKTSFVLPW